MISMPFAPSIMAFGRFVIGESWTAREKLGRPTRVCGWDGLGFSANWRVAPASHPDQNPNDINNPSAIHARPAIFA